jgi:hypothetical protein
MTNSGLLFFGPSLVYTSTNGKKRKTSLIKRTKTNSRTAKAIAVCDVGSETSKSLHQTKGRAGDLKIMNLMTFIDSAQMFFRNFGLRRATAAFGDFTSELAGSTASLRIIALFARVDDRSRARTCGQAPENSTKPQIQKPGEVCLAEISFR